MCLFKRPDQNNLDDSIVISPCTGYRNFDPSFGNEYKLFLEFGHYLYLFFKTDYYVNLVNGKATYFRNIKTYQENKQLPLIVLQQERCRCLSGSQEETHSSKWSNKTASIAIVIT